MAIGHPPIIFFSLADEPHPAKRPAPRQGRQGSAPAATLLLAGLGLMLTACGDSTVVLRNPDSGIIVRCSSAQGAEGQQKCIQNFEGQGFKREP
jgi:hypothetical protein